MTRRKAIVIVLAAAVAVVAVAGRVEAARREVEYPGSRYVLGRREGGREGGRDVGCVVLSA